MSRRDVPLSVAAKALEKAIRLLKQEAEAATLEALSARDGIATLQGIDRSTAQIRSHAGDGIYWYDAHGFSLTMTRHRFRFRSSDWEQTNWRPGQWAVYEVRIDGQGREWECDLGIFIIDDFGALVPVEGGAA